MAVLATKGLSLLSVTLLDWRNYDSDSKNCFKHIKHPVGKY